jgi:dipeptidyl aminopeptidase/acylaminoacyl peptidase
VDKDKVGCMGWSQADIFCFSDSVVGALRGNLGRSGNLQWATYYYNTTSRPSLQLFGKNPVDDPEITKRPRRFSYVKNARTPTLIQHGEFDRRVPIANAYELRSVRRQRRARGNDCYKGFGHGITKPTIDCAR